MKCKKCNTVLPKGLRYCPTCGTKIKSKSKLIIPSIIILILLIALAVLLIWKSGLFSAKSGDAEADLSSELDKLIGNQEDINFISENGEPINSLQGGDVQKKIMSYISYNLETKSAHKQSVTIDVNFTYPDVIHLAEKYISEGSDSEAFAEWIVNNLDKDISYLNATVTFEMKHDGEKWEITMPSEMYNILSGGMQNYLKEKKSEMFSNIEERAKS